MTTKRKKKGKGNPFLWMQNRRVMWYREHREMEEFDTCAHLPEIDPIHEGMVDDTPGLCGFEDD